MPLDGLELGFSRTIQWGGSGRPESVRSLYDALVGDDNIGTSLSLQDEPGNQLAGFDARYTFHLDRDRSFSIYAQAIGEDDAGNLPSHYLGSGGLDAAFRVGPASVRTSSSMPTRRSGARSPIRCSGSPTSTTSTPTATRSRAIRSDFRPAATSFSTRWARSSMRAAGAVR